MNAHEPIVAGELVDDFNQFFPPVSTDLVSELAARYQAQRAKIEKFHQDYTENYLGSIIGYFCRRNGETAPRFNLETAICALNSDFWSEAFALTDVYSLMPQKRRDEWNEQMSAWREPRYKKGEDPTKDLPDFEEGVVRDTLQDQLNNRARYFAERVDGIFRTLSKQHVTNCPQGFNKRMILPGVLESWGFVSSSRSGTIHDLRCVIARFMGREEPKNWRADEIIKAASRRAGEWQLVDGGSFRIRVYNGVGTAHIEVHPEMAWRLNAVLASLYPAAIPESFRHKPKKVKKIKDFDLFDNLLPQQVVGVIASMKEARYLNPDRDFRTNTFIKIPNAVELDRSCDKAILREVERVLESVGAVKVTEERHTYYQFDYDYRSVIDDIVCTARIPDQKSYQFYPTPESIAQDAIELATIGAKPGMNWLEPSAGNGNLADLMPSDANVTCYEISELRCKVLEAKGYADVHCLDFLKLASEYRGGGYDRIVMNPPYSEGRWQAHTEAAAKMLSNDGRLVAILPASARGKDVLHGFNHEWSRVYRNEFAGTSVSVAILVATRL